MIEHAALPEETLIVVGSSPDVVEAQRIEQGWVELNAHCVDCVRTWHPDGMPDDQAGRTPMRLDLGDGVVSHVPAEWLRDRLSALAERFERQWPDTPATAEDAIRELAIDAGLS